jgi:hypothetical protein
VKCSGNLEVGICGDTNGLYFSDTEDCSYWCPNVFPNPGGGYTVYPPTCEVGCGAQAACDEKAPNTLIGRCGACGKSYFEDKCNENCECEDNCQYCRSSDFASDCTAPSDLNGQPTASSKIKDLSCPSSVTLGSSFTISYKISGTDCGAPYEVQTIEWSNSDTPETIVGSVCYTGEDGGECNWISKTRTLVAPTTPGKYIYKVKTVGSRYSDSTDCGKADDSATCEICVGNCGCTGSISLTLNPSSTTPGGSVTPSASGLSGCGGKVVHFRKDSCAGTEVSSCTIPNDDGGCTGSSFNAPSTPGTYTYYACIDKNNDTDFADEGENDQKTLTVTEECTGSLTVTLSGSGPCSVEASLSASYCNGKSWEIKEDGNFKCIGTVSGDSYSYTCYWDTEIGSHTYELYIGGALKDSKSASCDPCKYSYSCTCGDWQNSDCVAEGKRKQVRDCNPDGCLSEERIVDDYTCYSDQTYVCLNGNAIDCSTTDCAICGCASGYVCENGVCNKYYTPTCPDDCTVCGCASGYSCDAATGKCCNTTNPSQCYTPNCPDNCQTCDCPQGGQCSANGKCLTDSYTPAPCADESKCPHPTCYNDHICTRFDTDKFYCKATVNSTKVAATRDDYCDSNGKGCLRDWNGDGKKNSKDITCSGFCSPPPEATAQEGDKLEKARWGQNNNKDACVYCGGGNWISDSSRFESGTSPNCCGNNPGEYYLYRKCIRSQTCDSDTNDVACCNAATDCVWNGVCYSSGSPHPVYSECVYCSDGTWVSRACGEHCRTLVGICSGGQNCWTKFGYQEGCPYLNCKAPNPPSGYIRSWINSNCGRTCTYILYPYFNYPTHDQDSICSLTRCERTTLWTTPSASWSITYPTSEHTYKVGENIEIKVDVSLSPSGFSPLLECRLTKYNRNNEFVGGILFNNWGSGSITFSYRIKPNCEFCEKYHGAACSNCFGSDQSYGSQTKACLTCKGGDEIAQQYCSEGCDPSGNWVIDYCKLMTDFPENQGWNLQADYTSHTCCVSTLVLPG